jgi:hypothetical protein
MSNHQFETKVRHDAARLEKDTSTLIGDGAVQLGRLEEDIRQAPGKAREGMFTWVEDSTSHIKDGFEKYTADVKESVAGAADSVMKDVGLGLREYNTKAQKVADQAPGNLGKKAAKYPWVAISLALLVGLLLGNYLQRIRRPVWNF